MSFSLKELISLDVRYIAPKNIGTSTRSPTLKKYDISIGKIFCESRKGIAILHANKFKKVGTPNNNKSPDHLSGFTLLNSRLYKMFDNN